jgi:hypothetical protein
MVQVVKPFELTCKVCGEKSVKRWRVSFCSKECKLQWHRTFLMPPEDQSPVFVFNK